MGMDGWMDGWLTTDPGDDDVCRIRNGSGKKNRDYAGSPPRRGSGAFGSWHSRRIMEEEIRSGSRVEAGSGRGGGREVAIARTRRGATSTTPCGELNRAVRTLVVRVENWAATDSAASQPGRLTQSEGEHLICIWNYTRYRVCCRVQGALGTSLNSSRHGRRLVHFKRGLCVTDTAFTYRR